MFRFTIRELALVTAVVVLIIGWATDHWRTASQRNAWRSRTYYWATAAGVAKDRLVKDGHTVEFNEQVSVEIDKQLFLHGGSGNSPPAWPPAKIDPTYSDGLHP